MLGTSSWGQRAITALSAIVLATAGAACVRNIDQDAHTGKDGRYKGAKKIELDSGEGSAKGIVTYPGGDRVDWMEFEIPEGKKGVVRLKLHHKPPRPGLDVAFNVYDQWGHRVARAKPAKSNHPKRTKRTKIRHAETGKYYVQIYAPARGDAGSYKLSVTFKEEKETKQVDLEALAAEIPDPPTLPAPVEPKVLTPEEQAAQQAADEKAKADADAAAAAAAEAAANAPKPVVGRIINFQMGAGGAVIVTVNRGKDLKVERGWTGQVLKGGKDGTPLSGGEFKVMKVTSSKAIGKVKLALDVIRANHYVRLSPP